jgi:hypothetical protein
MYTIGSIQQNSVFLLLKESAADTQQMSGYTGSEKKALEKKQFL